MIKARQIIKEVLDRAECPALLCSFGKDSMLLLSLIREVKQIPLIWFRSGLSSEQERFAKQIIRDWDLIVWSWEPSDVYVLPNDKGFTLVREQAFGVHRLPLLTDIEPGSKCVFSFPAVRTRSLFPHFDYIFAGWRDSDPDGEGCYWITGPTPFPEDGYSLGKAKVYAPLRHLKDSEVWQAIRELNVPVADRYQGEIDTKPDSFSFCTNCLSSETLCPETGEMIPKVDWNPQASLDAFRQRFAFN